MALSNSILHLAFKPPPQSRLPAALPACLEPVSNYLDLCLPAFLTSHSARLALIFCTILAPCRHLSLPASATTPCLCLAPLP